MASLIHYLLLFISLYTPINGNSTRIKNVFVFHNEPLTTKHALDTFFQYPKPEVTHAYTNIHWCGQIMEFAGGSVGNPCPPDAPQWTAIMDRLVDYNKRYYRAVLMIFDLQACTKLAGDPSEVEVLMQNNYASGWFGMRVVPGPKSTINPDNNMRCLQRPPIGLNHILVAMFDEFPITENEQNRGYTEDQLKAMNAAYKGDVDFVALDAMYLSATDFNLIRTFFVNVEEIIVYQLEGQELPDLGVLRKIVYQLKGHFQRVELMFDRRDVDKMISYLPSMDWTQFATDKYRDAYLNPLSFYDHLSQGESAPYTKLFVWKVDNKFFLNSRLESASTKPLHVPLNRLLMQLHDRRSVLLEFLNITDHHLIPYHKYCLEGHPFVLLRLMKGPNWSNETHPLHDFHNVTVVPKIKYIFGFSEGIGEQMTYTWQNIRDLAHIMSDEKFRYNELGVYLSAEIMANAKFKTTYTALEALPNWKYVIVRVGELTSEHHIDVDDEKVQNVKYLIKYWNRKTIFDGNFVLWERMFVYEEIADPTEPPPEPDQPTSPTTPKPQPPPPPTTTTTIITPKTKNFVTKIPMKTTPSVTFTTLVITFPTVAEKSSEGWVIRGEMVVIGGMITTMMMITGWGL